MAIFGIRRAAPRVSIDQLYGMLTRSFQRRGFDIDSQVVQAEEGYGWWFQSGSVQVFVFALEEKSGLHLRLSCPILHFPPNNREAFFLELLEINRDLSQCCLSTFQQVVMVTAQRPTQGLDFDELEEMLNRVSGLADKLDDELSKKYGAMPYYEDRNC